MRELRPSTVQKSQQRQVDEAWRAHQRQVAEAQRARQRQIDEARDHEEIQSVANKLNLRSYPPSMELYKIIQHPISPNKGQGWFAKENIMRGTPLLAEKEILFLIGDHPSAADVASARDGLSPLDQAAFDSLNRAVNPLTKKRLFETMNFTMHPTQQGQHKLGIFLKAARINHSCVPNSYWSWNRSLDRLTIHAMVDIAKDDEITVSYLDPSEYSTRLQRDDKLQNYEFNCDCIACDGQSDFGKTSEGRREKMQKLQKKLDKNKYPAGSPFDRFKDVSKLEDLLRQEKLNYPMCANMCHRAAECYRDTLSVDASWATSYKSENRARALVFARQELEYDVACTGYKSDDVTKTLDFIRQLKTL